MGMAPSTVEDCAVENSIPLWKASRHRAPSPAASDCSGRSSTPRHPNGPTPPEIRCEVENAVCFSPFSRPDSALNLGPAPESALGCFTWNNPVFEVLFTAVLFHVEPSPRVRRCSRASNPPCRPRVAPSCPAGTYRTRRRVVQPRHAPQLNTALFRTQAGGSDLRDQARSADVRCLAMALAPAIQNSHPPRPSTC
jgi:hypothetical protein